MGAIQGNHLFNLLNTNKTLENGKQILDAKEVEQAKNWGFSLFNLKENMTFKEFEVAYQSYVDEHDDLTELNNQEYKIHVKNLQLKYGTDLEPEEGESIEDFEARLGKEFGPKKELKKPMLGELKQLKPVEKEKFKKEIEDLRQKQGNTLESMSRIKPLKLEQLKSLTPEQKAALLKEAERLGIKIEEE